MADKNLRSEEKTNLHPRNLHRGRYDFQLLTKSCPELSAFIFTNKFGSETINFSNPEAVIALNKALLKSYYSIIHWDIPKNYLCPPIPGRADYIHYLADLLSTDHDAVVPTGKKIHGLDIGTGANCICPLLGISLYNWRFWASEADQQAFKNALLILSKNDIQPDRVELRKQNNGNQIFNGIIRPGDRFDFTMCNPPFHASEAEAKSANLRKVSNLKDNKTDKPALNFGGSSHELWYKGGESAFIEKMIHVSLSFKSQVGWFTTLVSKESNLSGLIHLLKKIKAAEYHIIEMSQGQKKSRVLAWRYQG